jgi:hypothetical protein
MAEKILIGKGQQFLEISRTTWEQQLAQIPQHSHARLSFMTDAHHQVRNFVVKELVKLQEPVTPEFISETLNMPLNEVMAILEELERKLFFLVRNEQNAVAWAYPVTVELTPHRLNFSTGERLFGA